MPNPITIIGTAATPPKLVETESKIPFCTFRVASNDRRFDRERNEWVDGETNWFTINVFRGLAEHAMESFRTGDRLIVSGRLRVRRWETEHKSGTTVEIDADALGHDVRWGVSKFTKQRTENTDTDTGSVAVASAPPQSESGIAQTAEAAAAATFQEGSGAGFAITDRLAG